MGHEVLVIGTDRHGVRIVTWGEERTVPWSEWWEAVTGVYVVTPV